MPQNGLSTTRARSLVLVHHVVGEILLRHMSPKPVSGKLPMADDLRLAVRPRHANLYLASSGSNLQDIFLRREYTEAR